MNKRALLVALLLVPAGIVALVWILRVELAQLLLPWLARSQGITLSADVIAIDHRQILLRRVTVEGLTADTVAARFLPAELVAGRVESVRVEGLVLDLDLREAASRTPAPAEPTPAEFPVSALPEVELVDTRARILLPMGEFELTGQATLQRRDAGELELAASFDAFTPWLPVRGRLASRFRKLQPLSMELDLAPSGDAPPVTGRVAVRMTALDREPQLTLDAALSLGPKSGGWLPVESGITFSHLRLAQVAALRPRTPLILTGAQATSIPEWLGTADGETDVDIDVRALASAERFQKVNGSCAFSVSRSEGILRVVARDTLTLSSETVQPKWLEQLALPPLIERLLIQGGTLQLTPDRGGRPLLEMRPDGSASRALVAGSLEVSSSDTRIGLDAALSSRVPAIDLADALAAFALADQTEGRFEAEVQNLEVPDLLRVRRAQTAGELSIDGDDLILKLPGESIAVIELAESVTTAAGSSGIAGALDGSIDLRISALDERPSIRIQRTPELTSLVLSHRVDARLAGGSSIDALLDGTAAFDPDLSLGSFDLARLELNSSALDLDLANISQLAVRGRAAGTAKRHSGTFLVDMSAVGVRLPALVAEAIDAELALRVGFADERWRVSVDKPTTIRLEASSLPDLIAAPQTTIRLQQGSVEIAPERVVRLQNLAGDVTGLPLTVLREPDPPLVLSFSSIDWRADGSVDTAAGDFAGEARVRLPQLQTPEYAFALKDIDLTLAAATEGLSANLRAARLVGTGPTPVIPPLSLSGTAAPTDGGHRFGLSALGAGNGLLLRADGEHSLASGQGTATVAVTPISFKPDGVQPRDLLPALALIEDVSGRVEAGAELGWNAAGIGGTGVFRLKDIALNYKDTRVSGLDLDLAFEQLFPLRSRSQQPLRIARIDAGLPIADLVAAVTVLSSEAGSPYALIEQVSSAALGGRVLLPEVRIDPGAEQQRFTLELEAIELGALTDAIALQELEGQGRLVGRFPVSLQGAEVVIANGRLQASEPGRLSFRSPQTRQTLAPAGDTLALMLSALEDFHYDSLTMTMDKPAAGESQIVLRLTGNNPAVLDGHPFDFTINLTGDLTPILSTLAEGNRLSSELLQRLWRLQRGER